MPDRGADPAGTGAGGGVPALVLAACLALAAVLLFRSGAVVLAAVEAIGFPASLNYGEGIVVQQALLVTGPRAYGDIATYPFIVFHYPPAYLLAIRALAATGIDAVAAARIISVAAGLGAAAVVAGLAWLGLRGAAGFARGFGAFVAAATLLGTLPVANWLPLARVDMLALALTLGGLLVALGAEGRRGWILGAAALFTLAVYAKQTSVAAPLAATLVLLAVRPADALRLVAAGLAMSLVLLGAAMLATDGGFLRHLVLHNINRFDIRGLELLGVMVGLHAVIVVAALLGLAGGLQLLGRVGEGRWWRRARHAVRTDRAARVVAGVALHAAITTPMLLLIMKSGSADNYLLEWLAACAVLAGLFFGRLAQGGMRRSDPAWHLPAFAALLALQVGVFPASPHAGVSRREEALAEAAALIAQVRAAPGAVLSDDMVILLRAGRHVPWESAIFAELASLGRWDEALIVDRIRSGHFAMAITQHQRGNWLFDARYNPAVADALEAALPRREAVGGFVVWQPAARE